VALELRAVTPVDISMIHFLVGPPRGEALPAAEFVK
jgi:hypothetical protein